CTALLDRHSSVRMEARYWLERIDPIDVAAFYRRALSAGEQAKPYSVISGLGETGSDSDAQLLLPYTSDRSAKIRKAAIRALGRLSQGEHLTAFLSGLIDEAPSVSREAMGALFGKVSLVGNERLWQIFCSTSHAHVKRNVLSLLERYGKWDSIYFMVKAIADPDVSVAELALLNIQGWLWRYNRT